MSKFTTTKTEDGFEDNEIKLIWEYLGGCIPLIQRLKRERNMIDDLEEYLKNEAMICYAQIFDFLARNNTDEEGRIFKEIAASILKDGAYFMDRDEKKTKLYISVIDEWAEKEILFYDPLELRVTGNSRIYEKGMEFLFK